MGYLASAHSPGHTLPQRTHPARKDSITDLSLEVEALRGAYVAACARNGALYRSGNPAPGWAKFLPAGGGALEGSKGSPAARSPAARAQSLTALWGLICG